MTSGCSSGVPPCGMVSTSGATSTSMGTSASGVSRSSAGGTSTTCPGLGVDSPGFGMPVTEPLTASGLGRPSSPAAPLAPGRYRQGPFNYGIRPSEAVPGGWRFDHDPSAQSFVGMDLDIAPCTLAEATTRHTELSTSPESMFVKVLAVQRRDAHGVDLLQSVALTRIDTAGRRKRIVESPADFEGVLRGVFGLDLAGMPRAHLAAVWRRQADGYAAYQAKKTARA